MKAGKTKTEEDVRAVFGFRICESFAVNNVEETQFQCINLVPMGVLKINGTWLNTVLISGIGKGFPASLVVSLYNC